MKHYYLIVLLSFNFSLIFGQTMDEDYPKIFKIDTDTIYLEYSLFSGRINPIKLSEDPPINTGNDGHPNRFFTVYIGKDTIVLQNKNFPFQHRTFFQIDTPHGRRELIIRYNAVKNYFTEDYISQIKGRINFELPEVYELANIIWNLSPLAKETIGLETSGDYIERVKQHFEPYLDHPVFDSLYHNVNQTVNDKEAEYNISILDMYYDFRENSFTYNYNDKGQIVESNVYFYVNGLDWDGYTSLFSELLPLIDDFAVKSNFREFYRDNSNYYSRLIKKMEVMVPVKNMWLWLDREFKISSEIESYRIVFSPFIGGSHSTQQYGGFYMDDGNFKLFYEIIMFVCGPERYDTDLALDDELKKGIMSGIVFTEIDHNYVNPETDKYEDQVNRIFGVENKWSKGQTHYDSPIAVFNEYMTHSLFSLWVLDNFDQETAQRLIDRREEMNADRRGFIKFREFNQELIRLKKQNTDTKTVDLYKPLLDWCERQL